MPPLQSARILDQLRERIRYLHYSLRTEEAYVYWAKAFIRFHDLRHPAELGKAEIEAYLMWLVATRNVSSSTHRQALSALLFLYSKVLGVELPWFNPVAVVATRNLRYIGMIKLTGVEINESYIFEFR